MPEPTTAPDRPAGESTSPPATDRSPEPLRWRSERLFGEHVEIEIEHGSAVYRLRKTSLGKLILTK